MDEKLKAVLNDIAGALELIGQAQNRLSRETHASLWKELGVVYDNLDELTELIEEGHYNA